MPNSLLHYESDGALKIKITMRDLTNHELRCVLIGFWLTLDGEDRSDFVKELECYLDKKQRPPLLSRAIADAIKDMP